MLKAFNLDFNWHKLTTWVNITEQWPLRASALIAFYEIKEHIYTDDAIPLKVLYDRMSTMLEDVDSDLLARDADEKKLGIFLSCNNAFQLGDLKIFSPFTVNLDPYLKRCVQQILSLQPSNNVSIVRPSSANTLVPAGSAISTQDANRSKLSELTVDGVVALLRQLDGFDMSMIDRYATSLRSNNINGKVLANCESEDLNELKKLLNFNFGDWLLFKRQVIENKNLINLYKLGPAQPASNSLGNCTASSSMNNLNQLPALTATTPTATWIPNLNLNEICSAPEVPRRSDSRSPMSSLFLNLEKQITMEEAALQSDIKEDNELEDEEDNDDDRASIESVLANPNELNVLYIGSSTLARRMSPSVLVDIESQHVNETTPLMSPTKSIASSSSSSSSPKKRLERQKQFDQRETNL